MITENKLCTCGKIHKNPIDELLIGKGVINNLSEVLIRRNVKKVFILADTNTYSVAGTIVTQLLDTAEIKHSEYIFKTTAPLEPDEASVGSAMMHFDNSCDGIIAIGSGVINDIGKILGNISGKLYTIVATAPSMDGYASESSSMSMDGVKVSLPTKCPDIIIGDIDILKTAPDNMLRSGMGDMLAKYISICEWRISNLITGEYYCEEVAQLVRDSLKKCTDNAKKLLMGDEDAICSVFNGLVSCGIAMSYAGLSRPASGVEHYISHIWDMRGLEFGTPVNFHGIQCAVGTYIATHLYEKIKSIVPDKEKALKFVENFDFADWSKTLRSFIGSGAEAMIAMEEKEKKYDRDKHKKRIDVIIDKWDEILKITDDEIPKIPDLDKIYDAISLPKTCREIGISDELLPLTFKTSKDIRDKYVLPRLFWDLGIIEEVF